MAKRQLVLTAARGDDDDYPPSLGPLKAVLKTLKAYNCWADGSGPDGVGRAPGMALVHGPGMVLEIPAATDEVMQILATMTDEEYAFPVLLRLCRENGWTMMDPESGRAFG